MVLQQIRKDKVIDIYLYCIDIYLYCYAYKFIGEVIDLIGNTDRNDGAPLRKRRKLVDRMLYSIYY